MRSHADDLRAEGADTKLVDQVANDYRAAALEPRMRALCDFAVKVTRAPASIEQGDVDALRAHAWSDAAIHDAIQVVAYFNYINRIADGVGIEDEPEWSQPSRTQSRVRDSQNARPA